MKVSVFGLGHVGSVTAACLARAGHRVFAVDCRPDKVDLFNAGRAPVTEPGLAELLAEVVSDGRLTVTTDGRHAVRETDLALVCVGTPGVGDGRPDVSAIECVGQYIGAALEARDRPFTVVLRSTVVPGATEGVLVPALRRTAGSFTGWKVAMNPEFLREGTALHDFAHPPLVLVGCDGLGTASLVRDLYTDVKAPFVETSVRTAELVKYSSIAFHGLKVCFANEMGNLCEALGADGREVMRIFALDRKLNMSDAYLKPGFAFGGSGLPKDVRTLLWAARDRAVDVPLLSAIMPSNESQIRGAVQTVLRTGRRRVGVVGLAFTQGAENLRECPVMTLIETLIGKGRDLRVLDRDVSAARAAGGRRFDEEMPHLASVLCEDLNTLVDHADVLVIGRATDEAARAVGLVGPDCAIVDLTRGAVFDARRDDYGPAQPTAAQPAAWR